MGHGRCTFKEADLTRALRAAKKAGMNVARAEVDRAGKIILVLKNDGGEASTTERNEWDDIDGTD
jgi:uncharacterized protein GlcG (DUF336 family)